MANKITESITLRIAGTSVSASMTGSVTTDQQGSNYTEETMVATESAGVSIDIGAAIDEGNLGYLMIRNLDTVNSVDVATDDAMTHKIATVLPGKGCYVPPPGGTKAIWVKANVADCNIVFLAIEK